ncbi:hypothetical protein [Bradyrhizobium sp. 21]|uniref:hypothetical protein n=1 Tax=Bradyrhizobium sp. 21 TaxID=2782666 RepID=UPI001FFB762D|nr:hypothetical protein [Bradyrhizobium sp. 21]MCK1384243.1 hypothetical protein [Bradyrhizobium sp. 21]
MPKNDYNDPELTFPRLQVQMYTVDGTTQLVDIWLWKKPGTERLQIAKGQRGGTVEEAHQLIEEFKIKYAAECDPDDIDASLST